MPEELQMNKNEVTNKICSIITFVLKHTKKNFSVYFFSLKLVEKDVCSDPCCGQEEILLRSYCLSLI
jgi:hypothetical protein